MRHNTVSTNFYAQSVGATGGASADIGFFGDFGLIQNVTVDFNLICASKWPGYAVITNAQKTGKAYPTGKNLVYSDNVFQRGTNGKCGVYGPVDEWVANPGNVWLGNMWDDGTFLNQ